MNYFMEIAKMRAARLLWAKLIKEEFAPKDSRSLSLRTHSQTSGWSLTAQDIFNNATRTCLEAMAATQGHTQSLHTNGLDEAIALPTDFSARIARNTQLLLQQESGHLPHDRSVGRQPLRRTPHLRACQARDGAHRRSRGAGRHGESDRCRHSETAHRGSRRPHPGPHRQCRQTITGVNKFQIKSDREVNFLKVDNKSVREQQLAKLDRLRAERDEADVQAALDELTEGAKGNANLLDLAVKAARKKANRRAKSPTRSKRSSRVTRRKFAPSAVSIRRKRAMNPSVDRVKKLVEAFDKNDGRRPRILIAKLGQDGHDRGQKVIASAFADLGFDVDIGPLFATADEAARQAVENDVHVVGVSSLTAGHLTLVPELKAALDKEGRGDIMIVVGGVIPPSDYDELFRSGAKAVFGPGTNIPEAAADLVEKLNAQLGYVDKQAAE